MQYIQLFHPYGLFFFFFHSELFSCLIKTSFSQLESTACKVTHLEKKGLIHKPLGSFPQKGYLTLIFHKLYLEKVPECTFQNKVQYILFFLNIDFILLYKEANLPFELSSGEFN